MYVVPVVTFGSIKISCIARNCHNIHTHRMWRRDVIIVRAKPNVFVVAVFGGQRVLVYLHPNQLTIVISPVIFSNNNKLYHTQSQYINHINRWSKRIYSECQTEIVRRRQCLHRQYQLHRHLSRERVRDHAASSHPIQIIYIHNKQQIIAIQTIRIQVSGRFSTCLGSAWQIFSA